LKQIITHYGYSDASGEYYVVIDTAKCDGCEECIRQCPKAALELVTLLVDLEDKVVAAVSEDHRKKIKYTCSLCKPEKNQTPCMTACSQKAIRCVWNPI